MKYKLLALDIDGTLIGRDETVAPDVLAALAAAQQAGLMICLATGRSLAETLPIWRQLELAHPAQPLVLVGGALISEAHTDRTLYQRTIDRALAFEFGDALAEEGYCAVAAVDPWRCGVDFYRATEGDHAAIQDRWLSRRQANVRCVKRLSHAGDMPHPLRVSTVVDTDVAAELVERLRPRFDGRLVMHSIFVPAYQLSILESFSAGTSKQAALTYLAQGIRLNRAQIVAVGDDMNDLSMISGAALGVAMPHAPQAVLAAADHVAEGGLARFIGELVSGKFDGPVKGPAGA